MRNRDAGQHGAQPLRQATQDFTEPISEPHTACLIDAYACAFGLNEGVDSQ
jgi:hypothetical protein